MYNPEATYADSTLALLPVVDPNTAHALVVKLARTARECYGTPCVTCDGLTSRESHQCYKCDALASGCDY